MKYVFIAVIGFVLISGAYLFQPSFGDGSVAKSLDALLLPLRIAKFSAQPADAVLGMPIRGVRKSDIADTWGEARSEGRSHEGQDIFAKRGTEIHPSVPGYVVRVGTNALGGNVVFVAGKGMRGYYYAHLDNYGPDATVGNFVATSSVIGYVGTSGNASSTPPHLHFGVYTRSGAINPYPLLENE